MKATLNRQQLLQAIKVCSGSKSKITGVTLRAENEMFFVVGWNAVSFAQVGMMAPECKAGAASGIRVDAMKALLSSSAEDEVQLSLSGTTLRVKCGSASGAFPIDPYIEPPSCDPDAQCPSAEVMTKDLQAALEAATEACDSNVDLGSLENRIRLVSDGKKLEIQATDRKIIVVSEIPVNFAIGKLHAAILGDNAPNVACFTEDISGIYIVGNRLRIESGGIVSAVSLVADDKTLESAARIRGVVDDSESDEAAGELNADEFINALSSSIAVSDPVSTTLIRISDHGEAITESSKGRLVIPFSGASIQPVAFRVAPDRIHPMMKHVRVTGRPILFSRKLDPVSPTVFKGGHEGQCRFIYAAIRPQEGDYTWD